MGTLFRKLRGALGVTLTWGAAWGAVFAALWLIIALVDPDSIDPGEFPLVAMGVGAMLGFVSGAVFGALLAVAERGKQVQHLSLARVAVWGALATSVYPLLSASADNSMLLFLCPIGAALAAGSVAIARRAAIGAPPEPPKLPT